MTRTSGIVVHLDAARNNRNPATTAKQAFRAKIGRRRGFSYKLGGRRQIRHWALQEVAAALCAFIDPEEARYPVELQGWIHVSIRGIEREGRGEFSRSTLYRALDHLERLGLILRRGGKGGKGKGGGQNTGLIRILYHPGIQAAAAEEGGGLPAEVRGLSNSEIIRWLNRRREEALTAALRRPIKARAGAKRRGVLLGFSAPEGARAELRISDESTGAEIAEFTGKKSNSKCTLRVHDSLNPSVNTAAEVPAQQLALPGVLTQGRDGAGPARNPRHRRNSSVTKLQGARKTAGAACPGPAGGRPDIEKKRLDKMGQEAAAGQTPQAMPSARQGGADFQQSLLLGMRAAADAVAIARASGPDPGPPVDPAQAWTAQTPAREKEKRRRAAAA